MDLCWMQLYHWWEFKPLLAYYLIDKIVYMKGYHQYGSWKDIKYLCDYIYKKTDNENHDFYKLFIEINYFLFEKINKRKR